MSSRWRPEFSPEAGANGETRGRDRALEGSGVSAFVQSIGDIFLSTLPAGAACMMQTWKHYDRLNLPEIDTGLHPVLRAPS